MRYYRFKNICLFLLWLRILLIMPRALYADSSINIKELYRLVQQQQQQIEEQQRQVEALRNLVETQQQQLNHRINDTNKRVNKINKSSNVKVSLKNGLRLNSEDGEFSFRLGGRIHTDLAFYGEDKTEMGSGTALRRARLFASGRLFHNWIFRSEIDFAEDGDVGPRDVWLGYTGLGRYTFKIGNFQEPFSLEEMTSSNVITFMERALPNIFAPDYHIGAGVSTYGADWSWAAGFFGETTGNKDDKVDDGWAFAGRSTFAPYHSKDRVFHLGLATEYRETNSENKVRFRSRPESYVTNRRLVDTRTIHGVDSSLKLGGELAAVYGPLSFQGEYIGTMVDRQEDEDLYFDGWYLYGSWFITGESRRYIVKRGKFGSIRPLHKFGAWELGIRYSSLNLNDQDIAGGKENNLTLGVNWYPNSNIRFMTNYIRADIRPNRDRQNESLNIFQMRAQLNF